MSFILLLVAIGMGLWAAYLWISLPEGERKPARVWAMMAATILTAAEWAGGHVSAFFAKIAADLADKL